jgi:NAD(P)-dependent dehydrogenase (short-subunit alcohol dehydrogenase family)
MTEPSGSKAALVVGGSGGLGRAICRRLAQEWPAILLTYRSRHEIARELCAELRGRCAADCVGLDLRDESEIRDVISQAAARFASIGTVVFAAGVNIQQPYVSEITEALWIEVLETELMAFTRLVRAVLPVFRRQGGGSLVALTSVATYTFLPRDALSAVPKAAIEMLCRAIAREEGRFGIRANAVAPGIVNAGLGERFQRSLFSPEVWTNQRQRVALRRFGEADEIAEAVAYLASERASYVTGNTIIVDGGLRL